jgi:hypothetical protein
LHIADDPAGAGYNKSAQKCVDTFNDEAVKTHKAARPVPDALDGGAGK